MDEYPVGGGGIDDVPIGGGKKGGYNLDDLDDAAAFGGVNPADKPKKAPPARLAAKKLPVVA
jgi:hypothetical protein